MKTSTKIILVAIGAEAILVATGLALAAVQGMAALDKHGDWALAASAAAFPLLLATLELFKIPAGWTLYHARWFAKPFALLLLIGGMVATFETVTMAGSTWFRALQFEVVAAQAELDAMEARRDGTAAPSEQSERLAEAIKGLDDQIATTTATPDVAAAETRLVALNEEIETLATRRSEARSTFATDWDAQTANNTARINGGNPDVAEQGLASQRSMPTRQAYIDARMADWDANEGATLRTRITEIETERREVREQLDLARSEAAEAAEQYLADLRAQRAALQADLSEALETERQQQSDLFELGAEIEKQRLRVAAIASESVIYDIAAKAFAVPVHEVTEAQANIVTAWVILGVSLATALSTGCAAFVAAHLGREKRSRAHVRALRALEAKDRTISDRDRTIAELRDHLSQNPKVEHRDRVVYRYLPIDRDLLGEERLGNVALDEENADAA